MSRTIGQAIDFLLVQHELNRKDVAEVMKINTNKLTKIIRVEKEPSLLMAIRMLGKLGLSVDEFLSLLSKAELARQELSTIKWEKKNKISKLKESSG